MKERIKNRALLILVCIFFLFSVLGGRLYYIQTVEAGWLDKQAQALWERSEKILPNRGTIYDSKGRELAYNAPAYTVIAYPKLMKEEQKQLAVSALSPILDMPQTKISTLLSKDKDQVELRNEGWKIPKEKADKIKALKLYGIDLVPETKRYYPNGEMAANILGYMNKDGKAMLGIEQYYDDILTGTPGSYRFEKDGKGYQLPDGISSYSPARNGDNLVLTLDLTIQHFVDKALDVAEASYKPKALIAIVADPKTGAILAMANRPNFNPNRYWDVGDYSAFRNKAITYLYEPGSTFKIATLAAAIQEGVFNPNETYKSGIIKVPGATIHDYNRAGWGTISYLEGVERSSNVAFVHLGYDKLGKDKLYSYIKKFGFGDKTGIDLPNETAGQFNDKRSYPSEVATATFGQGVNVTAIQQVAAVGAVANGGVLMKPYIVKEIRDANTGKVVKQNQPTEVRRVISEDTAERTRAVLEKVVDSEHGTGKAAYIEGYRVAGKTGTAQKFEDGRYSDKNYIASFIGFAPANDPKLVVYVMVDSPQIVGEYGGGSLAGPIFKEILLNSLRYLRVTPEIKSQNAAIAKSQGQSINVPDVTNQSVNAAKTILLDKTLSPQILGNGQKIVAQYPQAGTQTVGSERIYLITESLNRLTVPDMTGMSLRDALELCTLAGWKVKVQGEGYVVSQSVPAGQSLGNQTLQLQLTSNSEAKQAEVNPTAPEPVTKP